MHKCYHRIGNDVFASCRNAVLPNAQLRAGVGERGFEKVEEALRQIQLKVLSCNTLHILWGSTAIVNGIFSFIRKFAVSVLSARPFEMM